MSKIILLFSFIFLTGCNYSISKKLGANSGNQAIERLPSGTIPGYQIIASGIIAPKCLECHSSSGRNAGGVNLESYTKVIGNLAAIRGEITSGSMPKNRPALSTKEKEVILAWIDAGGPLESTTLPTGSTDPIPTPTPIPPDVPDPDKIDYQIVHTRVIGLRCIGCHSAKGGNKGGVNLETYENVFDQRDAIEDVIRSGDMPRPTTRPLTKVQKEIFLIWLEKGAPETVPHTTAQEKL
ncbi:MAG: hypothetical protein H7281_09215 [Bacteriovorax sp.]|nr:hypothetical protein [Bacteriovorax sp.]